MKTLILTEKMRDCGEDPVEIGAQVAEPEKSLGKRGGQASLPKGEVYLVR